MSTRCRIGIDKGDGVIRSIYCHFDGYPEGVGAVLRDHYRLVSKADKLIRLGDISCLGSEPVSCPEFWENEGSLSLTDITMAYKDRPGEKNFRPRTCEGYDKFFELCYDTGIDYAYIFDPKRKDWKTYTTGGRELGWVSDLDGVKKAECDDEEEEELPIVKVGEF